MDNDELNENLKEALKYVCQYRLPCSGIDEGNLFFAATTFQAALGREKSMRDNLIKKNKDQRRQMSRLNREIVFLEIEKKTAVKALELGIALLREAVDRTDTENEVLHTLSVALVKIQTSVEERIEVVTNHTKEPTE